MDSVADQLFDGRRFPALTVVDNYSRKCLVIYADQSVNEEDIIDKCEPIRARWKRIQK